MAKRKRHLHRDGRSVDQDKKPKDINHDVAVTTAKDDPLSASYGIPLRDNSHLYAAPETIHCARKCIPCAYKIGLFDVALDMDFCKQVPNQRPEQCQRLVAMNGDKSSSSAKRETQEPSTHPNKNASLGYRPGMSVLCVGDGDFSFSLALARILFLEAKGTHTSPTSRLIATSYESEETLQSVYPNFEETKKELQDLGATVMYRVDATKLAESLSMDPNVSHLISTSFDRICWNFPCSAVEKGQDGQNDEMEHNKELIRSFVASSMALLNTNGGEIQICHKTKPPFNQWKLEEVVAEGSRKYNNSSNNNGISSSDFWLQYSGRIVLDRALLPPYIPRKALDRKSFPCHDACIYVFQPTTTTTTTPTTTSTDRTFPSTLVVSPTESSLEDEAEGGPPQPVSNELILKLRARHMRLVKSKSKGGSSRYGRSSSKRSKR